MTTAALLLEDATERPAVGSPLDRHVMRPVECLRTVAALYVQPKGCYVGVPGVEPWDEARDARKYMGPHPVVAHPPCSRWSRWSRLAKFCEVRHGLKVGEDGGCFEARYGHAVKKATWLYVFGVRLQDLPELRWGHTPDNRGTIAKNQDWRGGMDKWRDSTGHRVANATPNTFRDLLLSIARQAHNVGVEALG